MAGQNNGNNGLPVGCWIFGDSIDRAYGRKNCIQVEQIKDGEGFKTVAASTLGNLGSVEPER